MYIGLVQVYKSWQRKQKKETKNSFSEEKAAARDGADSQEPGDVEKKRPLSLYVPEIEVFSGIFRHERIASENFQWRDFTLKSWFWIVW